MRKRKFIDVSSYKCAQITFPIFALTHTHMNIHTSLFVAWNKQSQAFELLCLGSKRSLAVRRSNSVQQTPTKADNTVCGTQIHTSKHRKRHFENGLNSCKYNKRVATATNTNKTRNRRWQKFLCCCRYRCCLLVYCLRSKVGKFLLTSI